MHYFERFKCLLKPNTEACFHALLELLKQENNISSNQQNMISMMLKLSNLQVRDVMVPRANMHTINVQDSNKQIAEKISSARHSRYPVTTDNKDEIIGILLAKNLLIQAETTDLLACCVEPFFIPESKRLDILLKEFQKNHTHMAIVKNEYNGVAGLITLEDVIEEILGEIEDEDYDNAEKLTIKQLSDSTYLVAGHLTLAEVNEATGSSLSSETVDTIGGFLALKLGYFPKPKVKLELDGIKFKIEHADAKQIRSIKMVMPKIAELDNAE